MKSHIQILCCENSDLNFTSILVFFDQQRYLFNVGEGTQRLCLEHKVRISKVNRIFFTQLNWKNLGGIPGTKLFQVCFDYYSCCF